MTFANSPADQAEFGSAASGMFYPGTIGCYRNL